ncbi:glucokinase [Paucibacter soli]|uniref:glucokinase n=1 Tax=Paucibacter soli TaxID=3133433 RepID=UPI0030AA7574
MAHNVSTLTYPRLLGDIGGTNARLAWAHEAGAPLSDVASYRCAEHGSLAAAIQRYLSDHGKQQGPRACAIGIANPVTGDEVRMTNHHWSFSIAALKKELAVQRLAVVNDFTALALSLPALGPDELLPLGPGTAIAGEAMAVLGPGTGLGVSGLLPAPGGGYLPVAGEGGHSTLAANDAQEAAVIEWLRGRFGHVSAERVLSGPGLVNLYEAAAGLAGRAALTLTPAEIVNGARHSGDPLCQHAIELFCGFLGSFAGNVALTLGARGGVYIGGGIAPRLLPELRASRLRQRFEGKGRFQAYLATIPCWLINAEVSPALIGASRALDIERFCACS